MCALIFSATFVGTSY